MSDRKPTICVDFDGVIHSYERGWQNSEIYGTVVPGFFEWLTVAHETFNVVVYSSRSSDDQLRVKMAAWLQERYDAWLAERGMNKQGTVMATYASSKPAALVTIDDRGITFRGDWSAPELQPAALAAFKPWNVA